MLMKVLVVIIIVKVLSKCRLGYRNGAKSFDSGYDSPSERGKDLVIPLVILIGHL